VEEYPAVERGLLLMGTVGVGKTHLIYQSPSCAAGSGSVEGGSTSKIVTMKKQVQTYFVHYHRFREGQRLPDQARQPLPQRVINAVCH
jgi:predicted ATPase